jgi:ribosomal-protein-alanine N-acetyltransferase
MIAIESNRLSIRNFKADDAESLREMILQKESSKYAIYDHAWPTSEKEIKGIVEWFSSDDHYLAVCLKETGKLIGYIGLNPVGTQEGTGYDLGYCFNSDYHGQGYASEGCNTVIEYAFTELKAENLTCGTASENGPSCRLLNRLGFKKIDEGIISFRQTSDGKPIEFIGWGFELTRQDWQSTRSKPGV